MARAPLSLVEILERGCFVRDDRYVGERRGDVTQSIDSVQVVNASVEECQNIAAIIGKLLLLLFAGLGVSIG